MNELIRELAEQASTHAEKTVHYYMGQFDGLTWEAKILKVRDLKFAELIVLECAGLCDKAAEENARTVYTFTETQEVGPALISKGSQVQAEKLSRQIKKHFGVEE